MDVIVAARLSQMYAGQTGIESQDEDTVSWARDAGHNVVAVVADHKSGAAHWMDRKNLRPWLTEPSKLVQYQGIVASRQDRLSRGKWRDEIAIRTWAEDNSKELFIVDSKLHWPPRDIGEQIRWELDASRARARWEEDSKQYRRMQKWLRDNGYLVGRPPYGYRIVGVECGQSPCTCNDDHKTLAPDPVTGPIALEMVEMAIAGSTQRDIAMELDRREIPVPSRKGRENGQEWTGHGVMIILHSETLMGRRLDGRGRTILEFEPLITREKWDTLQTAIARRRRGPNAGGLTRANDSMLAGVLFCLKCEGPLHYRDPQRRRKNGNLYVWKGYRCDGTEKQRSTCKVMINAASLDGWVTEQMTGPVIGQMHVIETTVVQAHDYQADIEKIENKLASLDWLNDARALEKATDWKTELGRLVEAQKQPKKARLKREDTGETVAKRWTRLDNLQRRDYLMRAEAKVYAAGKSPADGWRLDVAEPNVLAS